MNFSQVLAAIGSAPRTNTMLLALMLLSAVVGACMALYVSVPLAYEYLRALKAKRTRRKARRRVLGAAREPEVPRPLIETSRDHKPGYSRQPMGALVACSVLAALGVATATYFYNAREAAALRAADAEWGKGHARLRIDYELRSR